MTDYHGFSWTTTIDKRIAITVHVATKEGKPWSVSFEAAAAPEAPRDESPWPVMAHTTLVDPGKAITIGLQRGVPLQAYVRGLSNARFAPCGETTDKAVPQCRSVVDYVVRALDARFGAGRKA